MSTENRMNLWWNYVKAAILLSLMGSVGYSALRFRNESSKSTSAIEPWQPEMPSTWPLHLLADLMTTVLPPDESSTQFPWETPEETNSVTKEITHQRIRKDAVTDWAPPFTFVLSSPYSNLTDPYTVFHPNGTTFATVYLMNATGIPNGAITVSYPNGTAFTSALISPSSTAQSRPRISYQEINSVLPGESPTPNSRYMGYVQQEGQPSFPLYSASVAGQGFDANYGRISGVTYSVQAELFQIAPLKINGYTIFIGPQGGRSASPDDSMQGAGAISILAPLPPNSYQTNIIYAPGNDLYNPLPSAAVKNRIGAEDFWGVVTWKNGTYLAAADFTSPGNATLTFSAPYNPPTNFVSAPTSTQCDISSDGHRVIVSADASQSYLVIKNPDGTYTSIQQLGNGLSSPKVLVAEDDTIVTMAVDMNTGAWEGQMFNLNGVPLSGKAGNAFKVNVDPNTAAMLSTLGTNKPTLSMSAYRFPGNLEGPLVQIAFAADTTGSTLGTDGLTIVQMTRGTQPWFLVNPTVVRIQGAIIASELLRVVPPLYGSLWPITNLTLFCEPSGSCPSWNFVGNVSDINAQLSTTAITPGPESTTVEVNISDDFSLSSYNASFPVSQPTPTPTATSSPSATATALPSASTGGPSTTPSQTIAPPPVSSSAPTSSPTSAAEAQGIPPNLSFLTLITLPIAPAFGAYYLKKGQEDKLLKTQRNNFGSQLLKHFTDVAPSFLKIEILHTHPVGKFFGLYGSKFAHIISVLDREYLTKFGKNIIPPKAESIANSVRELLSRANGDATDVELAQFGQEAFYLTPQQQTTLARHLSVIIRDILKFNRRSLNVYHLTEDILNLSLDIYQSFKTASNNFSEKLIQKNGLDAKIVLDFDAVEVMIKYLEAGLNTSDSVWFGKRNFEHDLIDGFVKFLRDKCLNLIVDEKLKESLADLSKIFDNRLDSSQTALPPSRTPLKRIMTSKSSSSVTESRLSVGAPEPSYPPPVSQSP